MLLVTPVLLLFLASISILIIFRVKKNFALSFMIAAIATFAAWLITLVLRLFLPSTFQLISWEPESIFQASPFLNLDYQSWPFSLSLITICLAAIFTDSARTNEEPNPNAWAGSMTICAIGMVALLAGNPLTIILAWTFLDFVEFFYLFLSEKEHNKKQSIVLLLGIHFVSNLIFFIASMIAWREVGSSFDITNLPSRSVPMFILAAGLRLGILPISLPFFYETESSRGIGTLLRFVPAASSLSLLGRLSIDIFRFEQLWVGTIKGSIAIIALYASIKFASQKEVIFARRYWILTFSALALFCVINGVPEASRVWGLALLLSGSLLSLYQPPIRSLRFLLFFGLFGLLALSYSPSITGWDGIFVNQFSFWTIPLILSHAILGYGYFQFILNSKSTTQGLETWSRIIFPLGLIFIIQTQLIIGLVGWPGSFSLGKWWFGLISLILSGAMIFLPRIFNFKGVIQNKPTIRILEKKFQTLFHKGEKGINWNFLLKLFEKLLKPIKLGIEAVTVILEGNGGILWAIIILLLMVTLIMSTGGE